jgi:hemerythrin superfamily protein
MNRKVAAMKDGLQYLVNDHHRFGDLFSQYLSKTGPSQKKSIVQTMIREIVAHACAEERDIYPLFRTHLSNGNIIADRNVMDDQVNKEILDMLEHMDPERWKIV